jgi:uncharacterized protein YutE (UPF0331/DUF86 family)
MAGFRNVVVHLYQDVVLGIVRDVVENHLGDLLEFVAAIRRRLQKAAVRAAHVCSGGRREKGGAFRLPP